MKFFLLVVCCLSIFSATAQDLMQIGYLKFNESHPDSVYEYAKTHYKTTKHKYKSRTFDLREKYRPDAESEYYDKLKSTFLPEYRHFEAETFYINDIELRHVTMLFYQDTLIKMNCDLNYDLEKVLKYKYGEPKETYKPSSITCRYKFTGTLNTYKAYKSTKIWLKGGSEALFWTWKDYLDCEPTLYTGVSIEVKNKIAHYEKASAKRLKEIEAERKKELDDKMRKF